VRCIFSLAKDAITSWFPSGWPHTHLAYIEWFTKFSHAHLHPDSKLYQVVPLIKDHEQQASIVPISLIRQSLHLIPKFGTTVPSDWKQSTVLDQAQVFYVNSFTDCFTYSTVY